MPNCREYLVVNEKWSCVPQIMYGRGWNDGLNVDHDELWSALHLNIYCHMFFEDLVECVHVQEILAQVYISSIIILILLLIF